MDPRAGGGDAASPGLPSAQSGMADAPGCIPTLPAGRRLSQAMPTAKPGIGMRLWAKTMLGEWQKKIFFWENAGGKGIYLHEATAGVDPVLWCEGGFARVGKNPAEPGKNQRTPVTNVTFLSAITRARALSFCARSRQMPTLP